MKQPQIDNKVLVIPRTDLTVKLTEAEKEIVFYLDKVIEHRKKLMNDPNLSKYYETHKNVLNGYLLARTLIYQKQNMYEKMHDSVIESYLINLCKDFKI